MKQRPSERVHARGARVALVRAAFNRRVVDGLAAGARQALAEAGGRAGDLEEIEVPGAFELPLACRAAALSGRFDCVVALGAVIQGETDHYQHVAEQASAGLMRAALDSGVPLGFGVLTVREERQALARSAPGPENKGAEAMRAALAMLATLRGLGPKRRPSRATGRSRGRRG
ncbi:MAG: 6,7-dimethyl-8-ribityllumazine synthase [Vicinamibacteria bacterium]